VKAQHDKRESRDEVIQGWQQEALRDALNRADELELGDLVDQVDVVESPLMPSMSP
jgi:hypothetical protein